MTKIVFLGAGSTIFAKRLMVDILSYPELAEVTLALHDIDPVRLQTSEIVAHKVAAALNAHPIIEASTDRKKALEGSDYAIGMIQVAGYRPGTVIDFEVPKRYGLRQTIADTLGIGGIMRALRTIPVLLEMAADMEALCPDVTFLNHVNPLAMNCWALNRASTIRTIGLCHSVQGTAEQLAADIGIPVDEIDYVCGGINHMAFYLQFARKTPQGMEDLYPRIRQVIAEDRIPEWNRVRYGVLQKLGYFVTESSEHFSEYVPWFIKRDRPDLIEKYNIPLDEYPRRCEEQNAEWEQLRESLEDPGTELEVQRSSEYSAQIVHSMETGTPRVVYGNVPNHGLIENLPDDCIVEVPCLVDRNGVQPVQVGRLPLHLAHLIQTNIHVQALAVEAALTRKREHIYHAAMLDPHSAAELDLDQIWSLVDDCIEAHGSWLPAFE
jgi:alpha-galactosidase